MNHVERCAALLRAADAAGYAYYDNKRGNSSGPDNCDQGYLFHPKNIKNYRNYQMFRGYVHDNLDIIYLRMNSPHVPFGLGKTPLQVDLNDPATDLQLELTKFFSTISIPKVLVEPLIEAEERKTPYRCDKETVACDLCGGTGLYHARHGYTGPANIDPCKLCFGVGYRILVTEKYYLRAEEKDRPWESITTVS